MSQKFLLEFSTAMLAVLFSPLYETPTSLKNILQSSHFMAITVFCAVFVSVQSVVKASVYALAFYLIDLWYTSEDDYNKKKVEDDEDQDDEDSDKDKKKD